MGKSNTAEDSRKEKQENTTAPGTLLSHQGPQLATPQFPILGMMKSLHCLATLGSQLRVFPAHMLPSKSQKSREPG